MKNNNTLKWRVEQLEKVVEKLDARLDKFMINDWPHFKMVMTKRFNALEKKIDKNTWKIGIIIGIASAIGSTILGILFQWITGRL